MKELGEQAARLKEETETALKELDAKLPILGQLLKDVHGARQFTEDTIRLLRDAAGRLAPDASYMKTLKEQEELVRELAGKALSSDNAADRPYGEQLNAQAAVIASMISEARDLAAKLTAQVDRLERSQSQIGYAYAVKRTDEFIRTAQAYLEAGRRILAGTSALASKAEKIAAPTVPSQ